MTFSAQLRNPTVEYESKPNIKSFTEKILSAQNPVNIAALWGGGLGDLLVLRAFTEPFRLHGNAKIHLLTTASHLPGILNEICPEVKLVRLPTKQRELIRTVKKLRSAFDLVYLGPYPRFKTRLLGHIIAGNSPVWSRLHAHTASFLLEQVHADIKSIGLEHKETEKFPYGALPKDFTHTRDGEKKPYLVLHPGSKEKWKTTRWSLSYWNKLTALLLDDSRFSVSLLGTKSEKQMLESMKNCFPASQRERVTLHISKPLQEISLLIKRSSGVICHNSGILHLATLLEKQTVCITGSSARFWQPPYPWVKNISSGKCNLACNQYRCPIPFFNAKCILKLSVTQVWKVVQKHLLS